MENLRHEEGACITVNSKILILDSNCNRIPLRLDFDGRDTINDRDIMTAKNCQNIVSGKCLFLGGFQYPWLHHGHTLLETLCRWWPVFDDNLLENIEEIVFCPLNPVAPSSNKKLEHLGNYLATLPDSKYSDIHDNSLNWILKLLPSKLYNKRVTMVLATTKFEDIYIPKQCMRLAPIKDAHDFILAAQSYQSLAKYWSVNISESSLQKLSEILQKSRRFYFTRTATYEERKKNGTLNERIDNQKRVCTNEFEIEEMLQANFNILPIRMENLSMQEQIYLTAHAELIVGLHGSALQNVLFAAPGTFCLTLCDIRTPEPHAFIFNAEIASGAKGAFLPWKIENYNPSTYSHITWCYTWNLEEIRTFVLGQLTI